MKRPQPSSLTRHIRLLGLGIGLASVLSLAACGGGGGVDISVVPFDIGVVIAGQPFSTVQIAPGAVQRISIAAGQSIELDAHEPVVWALNVGGSTVGGSGATVYYGGFAITQTSVNNSTIVVDTSIASQVTMPVTVSFTATSTYDAAQVATFIVEIN